MPYKDRESRRRYDQTRYHEKTKWQREGKKVQRLGTGVDEDKKVPVSVRLPYRLVGRVERTLTESIATHRFPFRTKPQIYSYLILKGFESMAGDEFVDEQLPYLRAIEGIEQWRLRRTEAQQALSRVQSEIGELLSIKAKDQAVQLFWHSLQSFEQLPPNIWRDWMMVKLRRAFPTLERQKPQAFRVAQRTARAKAKAKPRRRR